MQPTSESMRHFMRKLAQGNHSLAERQHAANAVSHYFQMLKDEGNSALQFTDCSNCAGTTPVAHLPSSETAARTNYCSEDAPLEAAAPSSNSAPGCQLHCGGNEGTGESCVRIQMPGTPDTLSPQVLRPPMLRNYSHYSEAGYTVKSNSPEWDNLIDAMAA